MFIPFIFHLTECAEITPQAYMKEKALNGSIKRGTDRQILVKNGTGDVRIWNSYMCIE